VTCVQEFGRVKRGRSVKAGQDWVRAKGQGSALTDFLPLSLPISCAELTHCPDDGGSMDL
jgi:hypothetical protein